MKLKSIAAAYFSPTGNTRKTVVETARIIAEKAGLPLYEYDFTLPEKRTEPLSFGPGDLLVIGVPVYAGRIPNKILPAVKSLFEGNGALAVQLVTFGNRSYDNALIELCAEMENNGFHTTAGAAFVSEHVFTNELAPGRPDEDDMAEIRRFAGDVFSLIDDIAPGDNDGMADIPLPVRVKGDDPIPGYYQPLGMDGKPAVFLKAKPKTSEECNNCGLCAAVCPMGSIDKNDPRIVSGVCIKCQACIKACPEHAKYFDDPAFLSHVEYIRTHFQRRAANEVFI